MNMCEHLHPFHIPCAVGMVTHNEWPVLPDGRLTPTLLQTAVPSTAEIVR
jgi:hypothetical protein